MLNRYSSDKLNPVFYKIIHQVTTTKVIPIVFALQMLLVLCFLVGFKEWTTSGTTCLTIYSFLWGIQLLYFIHLQASDIQLEGMDPTQGTRLTPWQIVLGQHGALAAVQLIVQLPMLLVIPCSTPFACTGSLLTRLLAFPWIFILQHLVGTLLLSGCISLRRLQKHSSFSSSVLLAYILLPFFSSLTPLAITVSEAELPTQIVTLLCIIPFFILPVTYLQGNYQPISMDRDTLFRKTLLGLFPYALPVAYIAYRILPPPGVYFTEFVRVIYTLLLSILSLLYVTAATVEPLAPCYQRIANARKNGPKELLTIPWQGGAIPSFTTGIIFSIILLFVIPDDMFIETPFLRFAWLIIPVVGLCLLARHYNIGNLPSWAIFLMVIGLLFVSSIFFAGKLFALLATLLESKPMMFTYATYAAGLLLAFPALSAFYHKLLGIPR